jgi:hypothetical protein
MRRWDLDLVILIIINMVVIGTNQSKTIVTPTGDRKAGVYSWGDVGATWGDSLATWGNFSLSTTNQSKSNFGSTTINAGTPMGLLLSITYPTTFTVGSGVTNQPKS